MTEGLLAAFAVLQLLSAVARLFFLSRSTYPRTLTYSRGEDARGVLIDVGVAFLIAYALMSAA